MQIQGLVVSMVLSQSSVWKVDIGCLPAGKMNTWAIKTDRQLPAFHH